MQQKRNHRRSIKLGMSSGDDDDNSTEKVVEQRVHKRISGRVYPNIFDVEDEEGKNEYANRSWPPASKSNISLMEEQEEEEEEQSDDENEEAEAMPRRRIGWRQLNKKGRRSLPLADERRTESRSRSPNQQQQRPVPSSNNKSAEQQNSSNILWDLFYADSAEIPRQYMPIIVLILAILLIIFIAFIFLPLYIAQKQLTPDQQFSKFRKELRQIFDREMPMNNQQNASTKANRGHAERTLIYLADKMLRRNQKEQEDAEDLPEYDRKGAMVLLVASQYKAKANQFSQQYAEILQKNWPAYRFMNYTLNSASTRMGLAKEVLEPILAIPHGQIQMVSLLLQDIHTLRGTTPLFLHSMADAESSPLIQCPHNVLIIGTLQLTVEGIRESTCTQQVESSLLAYWHSAVLSEDQIIPIISRISAHSICLE